MSNQNKNLGFKAKLAIFASVMMISGTHAIADVLNPQIGALIYEENFNTLDSTVWNSIDGDGCGIGLCGWGNQELEYYSPSNLSIVNVPFEPATKALAIQARREAKGGHNFTSGKISTEGKLQIQYGMVEFRLSTPQVGTGLWPAGWALGTTLATWPAKGELDIMEMGHSAAAMAGAGLAGSDINSYVGSNAIFYATAACVPANPSCAASTAWQTKNAYVASQPLVNRFVTYRMYWTDTQLRFTVIDNGVEHDMYAAPIPINAESSEFQAPFYLLFNLAVGGNFTDAASDGQVTAPLPGTMYIDYIRVYKLDGLGEVKLGSQTKPEVGTFGVFTDNTPTSNKEQAGVTSDIWIWNTTSTTGGTLPAYEGTNSISWKYTAPQWFGGGIASRQPRDMGNFVDGNVKFRIKIPANVGFKVGFFDTYTNQNWVNFPANTTTYGLVRNGEWAQATIPVSVARGSLVALQSMSALFNIASIDPQPTSNFEMAIDDIVWECGTSAACLATNPSTSSSSSRSSSSSVVTVPSSSSSSVATSRSSSSSSVATSRSSSSSSSVSTSRSSSSVSVSSSSSSVGGSTVSYTIISSSSVIFSVSNASWTDIHFTVNNGGQQNVRLTHNADNTNTYILTGLPSGALVKYNFTVGPLVGGAYDTAWGQFTLPVSSSKSSVASSVASSVKSSVASSSSSSAAASNGYTKPTSTSVKFYVNSASWADVHYTIAGGGQQNVRLTHNADNTNTLTVTGVPVGSSVKFNFTVGPLVGGAFDTTQVTFTQ